MLLTEHYQCTDSNESDTELTKVDLRTSHASKL